jgi:tetratricopeptide (TPR) repeat protein
LNHRYWSIPLTIAIVASMTFWEPGLRRRSQDAQTLYEASATDASLRDRNASAFAQILGEVRATASDLMFVKANRYLHAGVGYAPRIDFGKIDSAGAFSGCVAGTPTVIRTAENDFRGFLGDLERQVKPYRRSEEDHVHTTKEELIPWFRLMTLSNPHFIRGYLVGSKILADDGHYKEARDFLFEGVDLNKDNPELFRLYQGIAFFHLRGKYDKAYPWPETWREDALQAARESMRLGLEQRPRMGEFGKIKKDLVWNEDMEDDFRYGMHLVALILMEKGELDAALEMAERLRTIAPQFGPVNDTIARIKTEQAKTLARP